MKTNTWSGNTLLDAMLPKERKRIQSSSELVSLEFGDVIYQVNDEIDYIYFPINCLISILTVVDFHSALEVGMVGNEGMIGTSIALGVNKAQFLIIVQGEGNAIRLKVDTYLRESRLGLTLQHQSSLYIIQLINQIAQTAACNRFHQINERLARWLLMTSDRLGSLDFYLTHDFLARMLGVRREGVTMAANSLKKLQLIQYSRGHMSILNKKGLEEVACTCYQSLRLDKNLF
jgi:CRP-like cAMP-binding protein